jgi:aspartate aminotransferase-like enzyme
MRRWRSDSLTVIKTPQGIDSNKIVKHAYSRYNLSIGIGLSQVRTHTTLCALYSVPAHVQAVQQCQDMLPGMHAAPG